MITVSIAISTFEANGKGASLLEFNLNKILDQDYPNINIVVSDHSVDNSIKQIVEKYADRIPILYIRNSIKRGSSSHNTNNAIKYCTGDIIKIMFMDDYLLTSQSITKIVAAFGKNPIQVYYLKVHKQSLKFYNCTEVNELKIIWKIFRS